MLTDVSEQMEVGLMWHRFDNSTSIRDERKALHVWYKLWNKTRKTAVCVKLHGDRCRSYEFRDDKVRLAICKELVGECQNPGRQETCEEQTRTLRRSAAANLCIQLRSHAEPPPRTLFSSLVGTSSLT